MEVSFKDKKNAAMPRITAAMKSLLIWKDILKGYGCLLRISMAFIMLQVLAM